MKKVLFPIAFAVILLLTIGASIAVLEMLARTIWPSSATLEHILNPGFKARYTTSEFDFVASINNFGFRGNEVALEAVPRQIAARYPDPRRGRASVAAEPVSTLFGRCCERLCYGRYSATNAVQHCDDFSGHHRSLLGRYLRRGETPTSLCRSERSEGQHRSIGSVARPRLG